MKSIYLIRHGESIGNAGKCQKGHRNMPLTNKGWEQAHALANSLTVIPELIAVSPFTRALQTASPFTNKYPYVPVETWNKTHEFIFFAPETCLNLTAEERIPRVINYWEKCDPESVDGNGAESFSTFANRVRHTMSHLYKRPEKIIFIFSHAQFISCLSLLFKHPDLMGGELMREFRKKPLLHNAEFELIELDDA